MFLTVGKDVNEGLTGAGPAVLGWILRSENKVTSLVYSQKVGYLQVETW